MTSSPWVRPRRARPDWPTPRLLSMRRRSRRVSARSRPRCSAPRRCRARRVDGAGVRAGPTLRVRSTDDGRRPRSWSRSARTFTGSAAPSAAAGLGHRRWPPGRLGNGAGCHDRTGSCQPSDRARVGDVTLHADAVRMLTGWTPPDADQAELSGAASSTCWTPSPAQSVPITRAPTSPPACSWSTPSRDRVLLCLHGRMHRWVQLGGHLEPDDADRRRGRPAGGHRGVWDRRAAAAPGTDPPRCTPGELPVRAQPTTTTSGLPRSPRRGGRAGQRGVDGAGLVRPDCAATPFGECYRPSGGSGAGDRPSASAPEQLRSGAGHLGA